MADQARGVEKCRKSVEVRNRRFAARVTRQVPQYGIKVSSWGSETFKIVIPVENHPQKPKNRLAYYHPSGGGGC